jgi:hypothetical protein
MTIRAAAFAFAALLGLAACDDFAGGRAPSSPPPPAGPPVPPSPDLPITGPKARAIMADLSLSCLELASLKADMAICEERRGRTVDHAALRTELRDLKWTLQALPVAEASARCSALTTELRSTPKPQVCWDLGND